MRIFLNILMVIVAIAVTALYWYTSERDKEIKYMLAEAVEQRNEQLNQAYDSLTLLNTYYNQLQQHYTQLQQEVANLEGQVLNLKNETVVLKQEAANQKAFYERQIDIYQGKVEKAKFQFYYIPTDQRYGVDDLHDYLKRWEWKEGAYVKDKFDCSQMSAFLEQRLENEGYHTVIVGGDSPDGSGRHAWLLVETTKGKYMPVEATAYSIVYWSSPYFGNYFEYAVRFETIQAALASNPTEFNWWD